MKLKVYKVYPKKQTGDEDRFWYYVAAPSKRIAKRGGADCYNNDYDVFFRASDMRAERFSYAEIDNDN